MLNWLTVVTSAGFVILSVQPSVYASKILWFSYISSLSFALMTIL